MSKKSQLLRSRVDDAFVGGGHQVVKAREYPHATPDWVNNETKIRALLLRAFPKLKTNDRQRASASRWLRVIHLYFRAHYTNTQVAEEMNLRPNQVRCIVRNIRWVYEGKRADGSGPLKGGKRGRPRIHDSQS